jgi:hypothetical protein
MGIGLASKAMNWILVCVWVAGTTLARAQAPATCRILTLKGEAAAVQSWSAPIGQGWVFRLVPIQPGAKQYSGWDLVVDLEKPAGFPDALLVASPPWNSINEREIGTTFGLRSQDAIGWNPRSFRFLIDAEAYRQSQRLFAQLNASGGKGTAAPAASQQLFKLTEKSSAGQLRIDDARLAPGLADPAPFALRWAQASARMAHSQEPSLQGKAAARGALRWMRFTVTLWLPANWQPPRGSASRLGPCSQ